MDERELLQATAQVLAGGEIGIDGELLWHVSDEAPDLGLVSQDINPGKPGVDAVTRALDGGAMAAPGLAFDIPIEQKAKPGLRGKLRIEARLWS